MNLTKLFKTQAELDKKILEGKGLQGQDLLDKKILALQVELGELANEWEMFKFWKDNPEPNTSGYEPCKACDEEGNMYVEWEEKYNVQKYVECQQCNGYGEYYVGNQLLEEYVDCLHFILSIGNDLGINEFNEYRIIQPEGNITDCFLSVFECVSSLDITKDSHDFSYLFRRFKELGRSLGLTWGQIEQAFFEKNKINHERQESGY